ncbi:PDZ domain-containing protein, partial [Planctomycetota bacterium]
PRTAQWLGATLKEIVDEGEMSAVGLGDKNGVLVMRCDEGSDAWKAGLRQNDVVREVNGQTVRGLKHFAEMWKDQAKPNVANLTVWRDQAETSVVLPRK